MAISEGAAHRRTWVLPAVVAAIAAVALFRFVAFDAPAAPATAPAARSADARVTALERAVAADPADLGSLQQLAVAYVQRAVRTGDPAAYDLARRALDRAVALAPGDAETLLVQGVLALSLHDFDRALALGERVHRARPAQPEALGVIVDAQVELGRYDDAVATLARMLDLRPDLAALSRASYLRELHGDPDGAMTAMLQAEQAGAAAPADTAIVTALRGDLHRRRGELDLAAAAYQRALDSSPSLVAAQIGLARVEAARGTRGAATARVEALVDRFPHPAALVLLAELRPSPRTVELVRSVAALQEAAGQTVDLELSLFEADHGDPRRALDLARRAAAARPANVFVQDALAWALFRSGDAVAAAQHSQQALRLGTADPALHYHAAAIAAAVGDHGRARQHLERVAASDPWFSLSLLGEAGALADRLGLERPAAWS